MVKEKLDCILKSFFGSFSESFQGELSLLEIVPVKFVSKNERQGQICHYT